MLLIRPLDLESGSQCTHHFALQRDVALGVSGSCFKFPSTGVVTSPNHGNYPGNYPDNLERTDIIQVADGMILSLQFTAFYIESHPTCEYDHLTIMDGDGTTLMEKSCGFSLPAAIRSRTNIVKIVFSTNDDGRTMGWSINWTAVTPDM